MRPALVALLFLAGAPAAQAASFVGSFRLPASAEPVQVSLALSAGRATVALGPGHAGRTVVHTTSNGTRVRFVVPGGIAFDGRLRGGRLAGTVTQGRLRGTFALAPGRAAALDALGLYRSASGDAVAIVQAQGLPTWLVELPSGDVHGLSPGLTTAGRRLGETSGDGSIAVTSTAIAWHGIRYVRVALRQREIRIGALAATLTLPPGRGPFAAVVMTHGSGPQARDEFQVFAAYCELLGIAVLADDKRGVGQSGGAYPGERATPHALDVLARDADAEVRYLRALPEIDRARVGLVGDSQASWVIALAAARDAAIRFAIPLAGPTVSVDQTDLWGALAGRGETQPSGSRASLVAQVRANGPGGFDPGASLARLHIPVHWVFADDDRNVPTELCIERLEQFRSGHDFTWTVVHATHTLFELDGGLNSAIPRSRGFARDLFPSMGAFLRRIGAAPG
ncbi:MAG TPA: alpha/beta hydrolase [Gaiellaceae bacterium]|nr:alpha/beta hydrolase [Gaiellaceae bacterium]